MNVRDKYFFNQLMSGYPGRAYWRIDLYYEEALAELLPGEPKPSVNNRYDMVALCHGVY